jgi:hypothetical protein
MSSSAREMRQKEEKKLQPSGLGSGFRALFIFCLTMKNYFNPQLGVHHRILNVPKHEQALLPVVVAHAL